MNKYVNTYEGTSWESTQMWSWWLGQTMQRFLSLEKKVLTSLTAQWSIPALNPDHFVAAQATELHLQCVLRAFNPHYMHCPTKINLIAMCMYK